jgi:lariat debranching enzyme
MAVPDKFKAIGDFQEYYSGARVAPYLTIFIGGNHEASNHLSELYYGGWVAPNIYYLGAAGVIRCGPLRIAGISGIWKGYDYRRPHFERLPYTERDIRSIYHVRELDVRKLLQIRTPVDLGLSHDWPKLAVYHGDKDALVRKKPFFFEDIENQRLGSSAAQYVLEHTRPSFWFSAHLHCEFTATIDHDKLELTAPKLLRKGQPGPVPTPISKPVEKTVAKPRGPEVNVNQDKINAWQQFYKVAAVTESEERKKSLADLAEYDRRVAAGEISAASSTTYDLTWKQVNAKEGTTDRHIATVTKSARASPTSRSPLAAVQNADEIDLNLDSSSEVAQNERGEDMAKTEESVAGVIQETPIKNTDEIDLDGDLSSASSVASNLEALSVNDPDEVASASPDQSPTDTKPETSTSHKPEETTPIESLITNKSTDFLALDKCEGQHRHFLKLVALSSISEPEGTSDEQRPYGLKYDKEWLAITRVFAKDLVFGDPQAVFPADKGVEAYRKEILTAEEWVEENIVKNGKMAIPENFALTAPVYDPSVSIHTRDQPIEYLNPQTEQFCELVGIENPFGMSPEAQQAQMAAIAAHNEASGSRRGTHSGWGHGRGHRGGRGGRDGRGRGRGRGRGA